MVTSSTDIADDTTSIVMASYFDPQPHSKATAEVVDLPDGDGFAKPSLLSPQVTRILEDMDLEDHSSSDEDSSLSEDSNPSDKDAKEDRKSRLHTQEQGSQNSPVPQVKNGRLAPPRPGLGVGSGRQKHPHMARFHSLRSMLFSSQIEENMNKHKEERAQEEAEAKWKAQHEQRRGLNRPRTPESPKGSPTKEGFAHRIGDKLRRMTSKEVPTMSKITESDKEDDESTASSDGEYQQQKHTRRGRDWDEESIDHSDIEDLVRWASKRDPPSDGEARKARIARAADDDSDRESLGHSDIEDLVRYASRNSTHGAQADGHYGYSDASTESDSEVGSQRRQSIADGDIDDLVRWISRKEGPKAGPVRGKQMENIDQTGSDENDSDVAELIRWVTKRDDTSGESVVEGLSGRSTPSQKEEPPRSKLRQEVIRGRSPIRKEERTTLGHEDIDELVRWVSRKNPKEREVDERDDTILELKRQEDEKKKEIGMRVNDRSLDHGDIDELVKFASKKEQPVKPPDGRHDSLPAIIDKNNEKKAELGMSKDEGSLGHEDVEDLVKFASRKSNDSTQLDESHESLPTIGEEKQEKKAQIGMTVDQGSLGPEDIDDLVQYASSRKAEGAKEVDDRDFRVEKEEEEKEKKTQLGMREDRGSLGHEDVDELLRWVSRKS